MLKTRFATEMKREQILSEPVTLDVQQASHGGQKLTILKKLMGNINSEHAATDIVKNKIIRDVMEMRWKEYDGPEYIEPEPKSERKSIRHLEYERMVRKRRARNFLSQYRESCCKGKYLSLHPH
jgi:hypothetical protein